MNSITIITIVVVALLALVIFGLTWLAYYSCIKAYKLEIDSGKFDKELFQEYHSKDKKKKKRKKGWIIGLILSYSLLLALFGVFITGVVYKINNESFKINNTTVLVIRSGSMSEYYDDEIAAKYNYDTSLQFDVGDICKFETDQFKLVEGEVYGYSYKNIIIVHRLVSVDLGAKTCVFRGDANGTRDADVPIENIKYHYTGQKVKGIGSFILFAQSYFGIWSLAGITGVTIASEITYYKINKIRKDRDKKLSGGIQ